MIFYARVQKSNKKVIIGEIKSADSSAWSMVARERFELSSEAPEAPILDR